MAVYTVQEQSKIEIEMFVRFFFSISQLGMEIVSQVKH